MLEQINRVRLQKPEDLQREVAPVSPYSRINPQQQRQEGYDQPQAEKHLATDRRARRRFTAMRQLIEQLRELAPIARVDFNTANKELLDSGLSIAEEQLINQLLQLKIPLDSVDDLVRQLQNHRANPTLASGRNLTAAAKLFPVFVADLAEYVMRFDVLLVRPGSGNLQLLEAIEQQGRYLVEDQRLRLVFSRSEVLPEMASELLNLTVSIQVGAVEVDENGRRAIFYQRPDQSYGLYSDKMINLSI